MAGVYMRNFRRLIDPFIGFCKEQNYNVRLRTKNNMKGILGQHCSNLYISFDQNNITLKCSKFYHKNENSSKYFIQGMAFIPAGIFSIFKSKEDAEQESELVMTIKRSILLIQKEEYKKAEQMLHVALKIAQEQRNDDGVTYIYDVLANLALEQKEYKKAETLFVNVMQRLVSQGVPQTDNKIVHMSLKIADIYRMQNNASKAEQGYKFCINTLKNKIDKGTDDDDTVLLYGMSLDWFAKFLVDANRLTEAFECFKKAYELNIKVNGEIHEETVVLLNDLGTICIIQDDFDSAISYLMKAVDIGEKLPDMKDFGLVLANLVAVYMKKGMYEEAKVFCNKGWQNATKHNNKEVLKEITEFLEEIERLETAQL